VPVLIDTCIYLWILSDSPLLSRKAREILDASGPRYISALSFAEIEIKRSIGKLDIDDGFRGLAAASGLTELPLHASDTAALSGLPFHHKDPFDRMLISQAMARNLTLITTDEIFSRYPVKTIIV
jgi:PIN domain nuclease of toxin-antitoxin system